jgi:tyrosyl-tRNA synthetase
MLLLLLLLLRHTFSVLQGQEKMSKSDPNSAIFMEDSEGDVNVKIKKAFCPPQVGMIITTTPILLI